MLKRKVIRPCPECDGTLRTNCVECGAEHDCDVCEGTGYDPASIDLERFAPLLREFERRHRATCAWFVDGQEVGRMTLNGSHTLDARPFVFPKHGG